MKEIKLEQLVKEFTPPIEPTTVSGYIKLIEDLNKKLGKEIEEFNAEPPENVFCKLIK